ncbi:MAG: hypothetical protein HC804_13120 [Anaerolineae bacterium]|nr:hypothetical protein [Anaerolineae bacterium]
MPLSLCCCSFWQISPIASLAQTPQTPNAVRYAAPTGSGTTCSQIAPCALQTAVSGANNGDQILVMEGTYTSLPGTPTLNITRSVTISGGFAPDWSGPDPTFHPSILDGNSQRVIRHFGSAIATLDGFHIRNGGNVATGAGVIVENGDLTIDHSWLYDNAATASGGAVFISNGANATIQNSELYGNSAPGGGAIHVSFGGAHADILFNDIHDNSSTTGAASGGAVYVTGSAFLEGNEIHHNTASNGGGVYIAGGGAVTAQNNMLYANSATNLGGAFYSFSTLNSRHNTVVGNSAVSGAIPARSRRLELGL